jgi:hypothetical protein
MNRKPEDQVRIPLSLAPGLGAWNSELSAQVFEVWQRGSARVNTLGVETSLPQINFATSRPNRKKTQGELNFPPKGLAREARADLIHERAPDPTAALSQLRNGDVAAVQHHIEERQRNRVCPCIRFCAHVQKKGSVGSATILLTRGPRGFTADAFAVTIPVHYDPYTVQRKPYFHFSLLHQLLLFQHRKCTLPTSR